MWCDKCHYGSEVWKPFNPNKCPQCGHDKIVEKNPFVGIKTQSIRAMWKRKGYKKPKKEEGDGLTAEIEEVTKGNLKARDYQEFQ